MNKQNPGIGWCDYTWNPITGCLNHTNGLCKGGGFPCYAYKLAYGRLKGRYLANQNIATVYNFAPKSAIFDPFYPRIWPERFEPLKGYPEGTKIFLNDMSDWMGPWIPDWWKQAVIEFIKGHPQYIFQTLTKQPQELPKWEFPSNCWVGVTATTHLMFVEACLLLGDIEATVKYISLEPLLFWSNARANKTALEQWAKGLKLYGINWLIIGSQTKPYKPPSKLWVDEIIEVCKQAGIPYFLKNNLRPLLGDNLVQDFPTGVGLGR